MEKNIQKNPLDKLKNFQDWMFSPESKRSIRTTLKIKPNTYEKVNLFHNGAGTMSSRINTLINLFVLTFGKEISSEDFTFLEPLIQKDKDSDVAIEESVKAFHLLAKNKEASPFYLGMSYAFFEEKLFIKNIQENVFDRKNLMTKTLVMSSASKRCIDLLSKALEIDKSTVFDFIINVVYQMYKGRRIEHAKRCYKPYKTILEKLHKLENCFTETKKEIRELLKESGLDEYDIDELFALGMQTSVNFEDEDVDPIGAAMGTFDSIKTILESDVSPAVWYAVEKYKEILDREVNNENN